MEGLGLDIVVQFVAGEVDEDHKEAVGRECGAGAQLRVVQDVAGAR